MKRNHLDFSIYRREKLRDPKFKAEYDKLQPEFAVIEAILQSRMKKGLTQEKLAGKIGTKQSVISRLESGRGNPTVSFLKKMADALGSRLEIRFIQQSVS